MKAKKLISLSLILITSAYANTPLSLATCPMLITRCVTAAGEHLGDIPLPSTLSHYDAFSLTCKTIMTQDDAVLACQQQYPNTSIVLYIEGALGEEGFGGLEWSPEKYTHRIDITSQDDA